MAGLPQGSGTILVADDDREIRDLTRRILQMAGFDVVEAEDAPSTIEALEQHAEVDFVLLDLQMPGAQSCGQTVKRLRELRPDVPIYLMTGFPESETRKQLGNQQVDGRFEKPFQPPELIMGIRRALGQD